MKEEKKDAGKIKEKLDDINKIVQEATTELYQKASQDYAQKETKKKPKKEDNVVDAEFEEEKEKK